MRSRIHRHECCLSALFNRNHNPGATSRRHGKRPLIAEPPGVARTKHAEEDASTRTRKGRRGRRTLRFGQAALEFGE